MIDIGPNLENVLIAFLISTGVVLIVLILAKCELEAKRLGILGITDVDKADRMSE